ncbi:MAG: SHOCT domain-containing protein [Chitinophagaceae bacterium]|nr:SHOCT domain-containing protein [Chitinophagaceae bacterium]
MTSAEPKRDVPGSKEDRLKELKTLFEKKLITQAEYAKARQKILDEK